MASARGSHSTSNPAPRTAAIIFAVPIEADAFARLAIDRTETRADGLVFEEGTVAGHRVAWCVGGVGRAAAERAARRLVAGHRPQLLVTAGFAGGLDHGLARGVVCRPARAVLAASAPGTRGGLLTGTSETREAPSQRPLPTLDLVGDGGEPLTICTVDAVVRTPAEKRSLAARTGAAVVDMESFAVAAVAHDRGLPCACVRVISDALDDELPREVVGLAQPQSAWRRLGAAVGAVGRRPGAALDLWRLWERAVLDGRTLATALAALCSTLPSDA
jgi:adenosylhomocysteine nucleosidase